MRGAVLSGIAVGVAPPEVSFLALGMDGCVARFGLALMRWKPRQAWASVCVPEAVTTRPSGQVTRRSVSACEGTAAVNVVIAITANEAVAVTRVFMVSLQRRLCRVDDATLGDPA